VPHLALGGLCPVLDLGEQLGFDPDRLVRNLPRVRLGLADQGRQALAKVSGRFLIEAMVDLAGIDQVIALAAADIDAVPIVAVEKSRRWSASRAARRFS
jgi:hypothetical protein